MPFAEEADAGLEDEEAEDEEDEDRAFADFPDGDGRPGSGDGGGKGIKPGAPNGRPLHRARRRRFSVKLLCTEVAQLRVAGQKFKVLRRCQIRENFSGACNNTR